MDNEEYDSLPKEWPTRTHMLAGAAAGILEHATMYPIDCVKNPSYFLLLLRCCSNLQQRLDRRKELSTTRMQSIDKVRYKGVFNALSTIYRREGYRRLLRGMSAMVAGAGPAHAMYFACYEKIKHHLTVCANEGVRRNSNVANAIAGASATLFHDMVMNPAEVIKQRMQMYGSVHKTPFQCIIATMKSEGPSAFYRSFPTQLLMNIPFQAVHFIVYELSQEELNPNRVYNPMTHMASGAAAGACAAFFTNPLDVCRTLLNTQEFINNGGSMRISGLREALVTIFRAGGVTTFFRGVTARVLYQMPSTALSWSVYELFKHILQPRSSVSQEECGASNNPTVSAHPRDISFQTTPVCASPSGAGPVVNHVMQYKDA